MILEKIQILILQTITLKKVNGISLLNKKQVQLNDFDTQLNCCLLKESARKKVVKAWDEKLNETIKHRSLGRSVSYRHLVKLECYKLSKHILSIEEYKPFKAWW